MTTIVTRQGKGSPLTNAEVDQNFTNLNNDKVDVAGSYANPAWLTSLAEAKVLPNQTGQSGKYLQTNGTGTSWVTLDLSAKADVGGGNATGTWPISVTGNAATVTDGVYTSGSYANPAWITSLAEAKVLPAQAGQSGKYLQTNGTSTSWATLTNPNNGTLTLGVSGTGLSGSATFTADQAGNSTFTVTSNATNANTAGAIVARDASGNFSAGTITATLNGNASTATTATYLSATQQTNVITGKHQSMGMVNGDSTLGSFVCRASGTGDANLAGVVFHNDAYVIKLGIRADGYFGLGGWSRNAWSWYSDPSGNMVAQGNVTAYSDPRLKDVIGRIDSPIAKLHQLDGVYFTWKHGFAHTSVRAGEKDLGVLADQVEAVFPEIVSQSIDIDGERYRTVAYDKLVPVLIEAVKELSDEVNRLKARIGEIK